MLKFVVRILINALALFVAAWLLPGIEVGSASSDGDTTGVILSYLFVGVVFGIVNALVRPIVALLSLPLTILTLGLFTIVINAGMLMLTAWLTSFTPIQFSVDDFFWSAVVGSLIISVVSVVAGSLTGTRR
ncbi:phage holin family protein [Arthrobacter sp. HLT1-21]